MTLPTFSRRGFFHGGLSAVAAGVAWELTGGAEPAGAGVPCAVPSRTWVLGAELEYYRMDPGTVGPRLDRCRDAGMTVIQTYVPWNVHQNLPGPLDFAGKTHPVIVSDHLDEYQIQTPDDEIRTGGTQSRVVANTDLTTYLHQCQQRGFKVILRPGPFISDEWRNGGLPDWFLLENPGMFQRGPDGTAVTPGFPFSYPAGVIAGGGPLFYFTGPSYAAPEYLAGARRWLQDFFAFARPFMAENGGPVVSMAVDDETCFYYRFGPFESDYHPAMVARYVARTGAQPPRGWPAAGGPVSALRPAFAWQRFKAEQVATYLGALAADLRSAGARVPLTGLLELQLSPPGDFARNARAVDPTPEFYNGDHGPWSVPVNELCAQAVRAARRNDYSPVAAEMSNSDVLLYQTLLGEGLGGGLQFTYTDGVEDGGFADLRTLGQVLHTAGDRLVDTTRRADTAIVWNNDLTFAPYRADRFGFRHDVRNVIESDVAALATALVRAGLAFDLVDVNVAPASDYRAYPTLWLVCGDILPRAAQEALVAYVRGGGRLVTWPEPPHLDEDLEPCTTLKDALYPEHPTAGDSIDGQVVDVLGTAIPCWRGVSTFTLSAGSTPIAHRAGSVCGYRRPAGAGQALLLGTWPFADSVPGRAGTILQLEQAPAGAAVPVRALAAAHFGAARAAALPVAVTPSTAAQYYLVYQISNQRRGGDVISGGSIAYWDGQDVVGLYQLNTAENADPVQALKHRPISAAHLAVVSALHGLPARLRVSSALIQGRVLEHRGSGAMSVVLLNRYPDAVDCFVQLEGGGRTVRLPTTGTMRLPATTGAILPVDYDLQGLRVTQATVELRDARLDSAGADLTVASPAGGELLVAASTGLRGLVDGHAVPLQSTAAGARLTVPPGEHLVTLAGPAVTAAAAVCAANTARPLTLPNTSAPALPLPVAVAAGVGAGLVALRSRGRKEKAARPRGDERLH